MPYNANIPQPTDRLRNSQNQLLQNFMAIDAGFSLNHIGLNDAQAGKHKWLTMPQQPAIVPNPPLPLGTDLLFYVANNADTGQSELYSVRAGQALPGTPLTAGQFDTRFKLGDSGWTYLPSGVLINWGTSAVSNANAATPRTFVFAKPFSANGSYCVNVTFCRGVAPSDRSGTAYARLIQNSAAQFEGVGVPTGGTAGTEWYLTYIAIGR